MPRGGNAWLRLANQLKATRMARGLTQRELARRIGRPPPRISELESGASDPRISTVVAVASALGLDVVAIPVAEARALRRSADKAQQGRLAQPTTVLEELAVTDTDADEREDEDEDEDVV